jgi:hypothetical protein
VTFHIARDSDIAKVLSDLCTIPVERIENFAIVVQYDTGVALIHTLCCDVRAKEGLAIIAATPPDFADITHDHEGN